MSALPRIARLLVPAALAAAGTTCHVGDVMGPGGGEVLLTFAGDSLLSVGGRYQPAVRATLDGEPLDSPRLRFASSDSSVLAVTGDGDSVVARALGHATLTVTLASSIAPRAGGVLTQEMRVGVHAVEIDGAGADPVVLPSLGATTTLTATATDAEGRALADAPLRWRSADTNIVRVDSVRGRLTARANGTALVSVSAPYDTATIEVRVQQTVARFAFPSPSLVLDALGATLPLVASPRDASDSVVAGVTPVWSSADPAVAAIVPTGDSVVARAPGSSWIRVTPAGGGPVDSIAVLMQQRATRVVVSPHDGLAISSVGGELPLTALAYDRLGQLIVSGRPAWRTLDPTIASVDPVTGRVLALAVGAARIVAALDAGADTVTVYVSNVPASIAVAPSSATIRSLGGTLQLQATVRNDNGDVLSGIAVTWAAVDTTIARVDATGLATGVALGTTRIVASTGTIADTAVVTVTDEITSLDIIPATATIPSTGDSIVPPVSFRDARGDTLPRTAAAWSSDDPAVARVTAAGTVIATGTGTTNVRAASPTNPALRDSLLVTVTNTPASIVLDGFPVDTLTAPTQALTYTATVTNSHGTVLAGYAPVWTSTAPGVVTVSGGATATATAVGFGTARIIAQADAVADTVTITVVDPTLLVVDNGVAIAPRVGTRTRPYLHIQDAIAAATPGDTVLVRPGATPYREGVVVPKRLVLLGDSAAFLAAGRDPARLPAVSHDTGAVGIVVSPRVLATVRLLAIQQNIDGPALFADHASVQLQQLYVNPGYAFSLGRGILVRGGGAVLRDVQVTKVAGYGILLDTVASATVARALVSGVEAAADAPGTGIEVRGGRSNTIDSSTVRGTAGAQILLAGTDAALVRAGDLAGRATLLRAEGATGAQIVGTSFAFGSALPGDPALSLAALDTTAALELRSGTSASVSGGTFSGETGLTATRLMDAVRLVDVRSDAGATSFDGVVFSGGRYQLHSRRSTWTLSRSRAELAQRAVTAEEGDTITLASDTLRNVAGKRCVSVRGAAASVSVQQTLFTGCSAATADSAGVALDVQGSGASLTVSGSTFRGTGESALLFAGDLLNADRSVLAGTGDPVTSTGTPSSLPVVDSAALHATGTTLVLTENQITDFPGRDGVRLSGGAVTLTHNLVARNRVGARLVAAASVTAARNDVVGNAQAGAVGVPAALVVDSSWWGDVRGPRGLGNANAVGDSTINVGVGTFAATGPFFPSATATAAGLVKVRGDGQVATTGSILPLALSVRVVDATGRPVPNVDVTFVLGSAGNLWAGPPPVSGGGSSSSVTARTNVDGLAEATWRIKVTGANTVTVRRGAWSFAPAEATFTATGQ